MDDKCCYYTDFHHDDYTTVLDNSASTHIIGDNQLFIDDVKTCPIVVDVDAVTGYNTPQGILTARFCWLDNDGCSHFCNL